MQCFSEISVPGNKIEVPGGTRVTLSLVTHDPVSGVDVKKRFSFEGDDYKIGFGVTSNQLNNSKVQRVSWPAGIAESEMLGSGRFFPI